MENSPSITDWIQAGCAFLGLIGLIVTVWKLFAKDQDREKEIKSLMIQAKNSGILTEAQLESNNITREYMGKLSDLLFKITDGKVDKETVEKLNESTLQLRKNDIQPIFIEDDVTFGVNFFELSFKNVGEIAQNVVIKMTERSEYDVKIREQLVVERNKGITMQMNDRSKLKGVQKFVIYFDNKDGDRYMQTFEVDFDTKLVNLLSLYQLRIS